MLSRIQSLNKFFSRSKVSGNHFRHIAHYENVLGTSLEIQVVAKQETIGLRAETVILAEIDRLEKIFNAYSSTSELARWQMTRKERVSVSSELALLLNEAEKWRVITNGAFNPATEALTRLWEENAGAGKPVAEEELTPLVQAMSGPLWQVNLESTVATRLTELPVTLNSIAKGFIIDRACLVASAIEDVTDVLINIGGDLRHFGIKPLTIAIANPYNDAENAVPVARIAIHNQGLATSGNYRRGFQVGEQWYSHILDPRTGWPVESLVGVSVAAPDALSADVLATAFSILPIEDSLELAESMNSVAVLLINQNGQQFSNRRWKEQSGK
jgi:thiamine biosynthesis lipoprotein